MSRTYLNVSDEQRELLLKLILTDKLSIRRAAEQTGIFYHSAVRIHKIFKTQNRIHK